MKPGAALIMAAGGLVALVGIVRASTKAPPLDPADIYLSGLTIEPAEAYVGEPVTISVIATNTGAKRGSYEVVLEVLP